jgi:hypothetical protein
MNIVPFYWLLKKSWDNPNRSKDFTITIYIIAGVVIVFFAFGIAWAAYDVYRVSQPLVINEATTH